MQVITHRETPDRCDSNSVSADRGTTKAMKGPLAEQPPETIAALQTVLDVACGPGGWVLDVAFAHPDIEVAGVDISTVMIDYANARASSQQIPNASFGSMDINKPLDFSDASFDLVNARFINGVLRKENWAPFVAECTRLLRPGGFSD